MKGKQGLGPRAGVDRRVGNDADSLKGCSSTNLGVPLKGGVGSLVDAGYRIRLDLGGGWVRGSG